MQNEAKPTAAVATAELNRHLLILADLQLYHNKMLSAKRQWKAALKEFNLQRAKLNYLDVPETSEDEA